MNPSQEEQIFAKQVRIPGGKQYTVYPRIRASKASIVVIDQDVFKKELKKRIRYIQGKYAETKKISKTKKCKLLYGWINNYSHTLIHIYNGSNDKYIDTTKIPVEYDNEVFYFPSNLFNVINCTDNKYYEGKYLIIEDNKGNKLKARVIHVLSDGQIVPEDNQMLQLEFQWQRIYKSFGTVNTLLQTSINYDENITNVCRQVALFQLNISLGVQDSEYTKLIEESIASFVTETIQEYFQLIASIIVFTSNIYFGKYAQTFKQRLVNKIYKPDIVMRISKEDKFPEIYDNNKVTENTRKFIDNVIFSDISEIIVDLATLSHNEIFPTRRVATKNSYAQPLSVIIPEHTISCVNKGDISGHATWEIIQYEYDNKLYCFKIVDLVNQFVNNDFINKFTGVEFDSEFINNVIEVYNEQTVSPLPVVDEVIKKDEEEPSLNLIELLYSEIQKLELKLTKLPESKLHLACEYCNEHITKNKVSSINSDGEVISFCNTQCMSKMQVAV